MATAVNRMRGSKAKSKVVVLVTDGRSNTGQLGPESAAEAARALGFKVYTIGVGSEGEVPCLVDDPGGLALRQVYWRISTRPDCKIAETTGARYFRRRTPNGSREGRRSEDRRPRKTGDGEPHAHPLHGKFGRRCCRGSPPASELLLAGTRLKRSDALREPPSWALAVPLIAALVLPSRRRQPAPPHLRRGPFGGQPGSATGKLIALLIAARGDRETAAGRSGDTARDHHRKSRSRDRLTRRRASAADVALAAPRACGSSWTKPRRSCRWRAHLRQRTRRCPLTLDHEAVVTS